VDLLSRTHRGAGLSSREASTPVIYHDDVERTVALRLIFFLALAGWSILIATPSFAAGDLETESVESKTPVGETIIQIYGRMCEYHREDVETALRAFTRVRQVEFLNDHGTVLVGYQPDGDPPEQFADAVHRALVSGWNCSARVDRGEHAVITRQLEERP
jgi:hypothetical protein